MNFFKTEDVEKIGEHTYVGDYNIFLPIQEEKIIKAETILGVPFPEELKLFYKTFGYGHLMYPHNAPEDYSFGGSNEILPPIAAANFAKGILFWEGQRNWMSEDAYEDLQPGDLPFFEMYDSSYFLIMKLNSENPNAVWYNTSKVTDSFEEFIYRLYYEKPDFYGNYM